jgi:hypothetical protein
MGKERVFSHLSDNAMKIFAECSVGKRDWKEASSEISMDELNLLFTFSDICGWRYDEKDLAYFSESLQFLYSDTKRRKIRWHDINPVSQINYVINGMKKCGQMTYASVMDGYISKLKSQP